MIQNSHYVYGLFDKTTNLPFYIGMSGITNYDEENIALRYKRAFFHLQYPTYDNNRNSKKILELLENNNVEVKILKENMTKKDAFALEKKLIKEFGRKNIDKDGILLNIAPGGKTFSRENLIIGIRLSQKHKQESRKRLIAYNKSKEKREKLKLSNHLHPRVNSKESREKLAKSQSAAWKRKSDIEKTKANIAKSLGRAWNVLKRIDGNIVNEQIFNSHRSKGSRLANTEPRWNTIVSKVGSIDKFLLEIEQRFGKRFIYED